MIFVTVGSQKFQFNRLLKEVDDLIENGTIKEEVFAQTGASGYRPKNYKYVDFTTREEFVENLDKCNLLITHAGTGVIVAALKKDKKVIAVPRLAEYGEHVDDHQVQLVKQFDELNLIYPAYKTKDLKAALMSNSKKIKAYTSNTEAILNNIEEFIGE